MGPAAPDETLHDAGNIVEPDSEVEVVVRPRDAARVEVDSPAAEEPVRDLLSVELCRDLPEGGELARSSRRPIAGTS